MIDFLLALFGIILFLATVVIALPLLMFVVQFLVTIFEGGSPSETWIYEVLRDTWRCRSKKNNKEER